MKKLRKLIYRNRSFLVGCAIGIIVCVAITKGYNIILQHETVVPYEPGGVQITWLPSTVQRFSSEIEKEAKRYGINPGFVAIIMTLESGGYTQADSGQAQGLMQITPPTAVDIAKKYLQKPRRTYDLFDTNTSIEFGIAYLAHLRDTFCEANDGPSWDTCVEVIAAGYNGGPGAAINLITGKGLADTQTLYYSRNALNMWRERKAILSPTYDRWLAAGGQSLINKALAEKL